MGSAGAKSVAEVLQAEDTKYMGHLTEEDKPRVVTFGLRETNDWRAVMVAPNTQGGTDYVVVKMPYSSGAESRGSSLSDYPRNSRFICLQLLKDCESGSTILLHYCQDLDLSFT